MNAAPFGLCSSSVRGFGGAGLSMEDVEDIMLRGCDGATVWLLLP